MASTLWQHLLKRVSSCLDPEVERRIDILTKRNLNSFGVDPFGFDPSVIKLVAPVALWLYRHYFRCEVFGAKNIPPDGRMVVIANHSGQVPFDAMMIATTFLLEGQKPRMLRAMSERWCAELPFISSFYVRGGQVVGEANSCRRLLAMDEAVFVFPEGVKGIIKLFKDRYKLTDFGQGFMRLALEAKAPIVPVSLVGAEEQAPSIANLSPIAKLLGFPALPVIFPQIIPVPLPVKYRIYIGKPMYFEGDGNEDDPVVASYVSQVKSQIQETLHKGQKERKSIFF